MTDYDLNAPAFGPGSQSATGGEPESVGTQEVSVETPAEVEEEVSSVEENKVPYSRFKNIHNRALEAERMAAEYQSQLSTLMAQQKMYRQPQTEESTIPSFWMEMYGDSEASKRAWKLQDEQNQLIKQQAREEALSAVREQQSEEVERVNQNLETIDGEIDALSNYIGRELTDKEQSAILDIVDEYTPQDENGNYLGATIPFNKAWDIYEMKLQAQQGPRKQARDSVAQLNSSQSQGETNVGSGKNTEFNPMDWNAWRKRL